MKHKIKFKECFIKNKKIQDEVQIKKTGISHIMDALFIFYN